MLQKIGDKRGDQCATGLLGLRTLAMGGQPLCAGQQRPGPAPPRANPQPPALAARPPPDGSAEPPMWTSSSVCGAEKAGWEKRGRGRKRETFVSLSALCGLSISRQHQ